MSSISLLELARLNEMNSKLLSDNTVSVKLEKTAQVQDVFKRKLRRLLTLLVAYDAAEDMTQKDIQSIIHLLREVIPHMQKKERTQLVQVYKEIGKKMDKK